MSLVEFRVWLLDGQGNNHIREVKINDRASNRYTGEIIYKEPGHHMISLTGEADFSPPEREIVLSLDDQRTLEVEFYLGVLESGGGDRET